MPERGTRTAARLYELTPKQRQVVDLMAQGRTNFEIAQALGLSLDGAKYHVSEVLAKLGVTSREEAVDRWREHNRPLARAKRALKGIVPTALAASPAIKAAVAAVALGGVVVAATAVSLLRADQDSGP